MRAYADPLTPRKNVWQDANEEPRPEMTPLGPAVVGLIPSPTFVKNYQKHDAEFLQKARHGKFKFVLFHSLEVTAGNPQKILWFSFLEIFTHIHDDSHIYPIIVLRIVSFYLYYVLDFYSFPSLSHLPF